MLKFTNTPTSSSSTPCNGPDRQDQAAAPKQELMPSVLQVSASLKLKDIFELQHELLPTASTLLLTEVWRHYRLISALADCISIHWRARLNKYRSQNIIVGWVLGFPSCPSLTWTSQVHCSTASWSCGPRLAVGCCSKAKQSHPISFHHWAAEQKWFFFCFVFPLTGVFHSAAAGTRRSNCGRQNVCHTLGRFKIYFCYYMHGSGSLD